MQITVVSKVQGITEFSSEGVSVVLEAKDIGLESPKTPEETEVAFSKLNDFANYLIITALFKFGRVSKATAITIREPWLKQKKT